MSTKAIYKRIALVAVATLGAGVLSVAPASAAITSVAVVSGADNVYGAVGATIDTPISLTTTTATTEAHSIVLTPTVTNKPNAATMTIGTAASTRTGLVTPVVTGSLVDTNTVNRFTSTVATGVQTLAYSSGTVPELSAVQVSTLTMNAATPGTYQITITPTNAATTNTAKVVTFRIYPTAAQATAAAIAGANSRIVSVLGDGGTPASTLSVVGVAGPANTVQVAAIGDTSTGALPRIVSVTGAGTYFTSAGGAGATLSSGTNPTTATVTAIGSYGTLTIATPTVGTATVTIAAETSAGSGIYGAVLETVTITVNAAATSGAVDTATSTAFMNKNATVNAATTEATAPLTTPAKPAGAAATPTVAIQVTVGRANGAITGTTAVTASITGPGTLVMSANDTDPTNTAVATGRSISSTAATMLAGNDIFSVGVAPDGVAGVSTITITAGTYTVTKTVTFVGSVASLTFTKVRGSIVDTADGVAAGDTDAYAGFISGKDAAGNAVTLTAAEFTAVTAAQLTAAVITGAAVVAGTAATYSGVAVAANVPTVVIDPTATKTGAKTLTLTHTASKLTVAVPFTVGLAQATTVTLTTDKPVYGPGEKMTLSITALGKDGIAIGDSAVAAFFTTVGIVSSVSINGESLVVTAPAFAGGVSTLALFAPLSAGPITFTATTSTAATAPTTAITVTGTAAVENPEANAATDAANEATDAANAATDAALAAADAADAATAAAQDAADAVAALSTRVSTLVSDLRKQISALTKLVKRLL